MFRAKVRHKRLYSTALEYLLNRLGVKSGEPGRQFTEQCISTARWTPMCGTMRSGSRPSGGHVDASSAGPRCG